MNEVSRMYVFNSRYLRNSGVRKGTLEGYRTHQLTCKEQDSLRAEIPVAEVEEVLEIRRGHIVKGPIPISACL